MTGKTHLVASVVAGAAVSAKFDFSVIHVVICVIGGLFPDTDMPKSYLGRFIPLWLVTKSHRMNITHSLLGAIAFSLFWILPSYMFIFFIGYMSHLLLDMCNRTGVALWWPNKRMVTIANIRVGGLGELLVTFIFYMIVIVLLSYW